MKLATRCIAMMAVAFVMLPALHANDADKPKANTEKATASLSAKAGNAENAQPNTQPNTEANTQPAANTALPTRPAAASPARPAAVPRPGDAARRVFVPRVEWFLGYSFWRAMPTSPANRMGYLHGGSTSLAINLDRYVGLVADFGVYDNSRITLMSPAGNQTFDSNGTAYTYTIGPRFSYRRYARITPFGQVLLGGTHTTPVALSGCNAGGAACTVLGSDNAFALFAGVGFDINISHHFALRPFQGEYLLTRYKDPFSSGGRARDFQNNAALFRGHCLSLRLHRRAAGARHGGLHGATI